MTREVRRRHLFVFLVLALLLPLGFFLGLAGRRPIPAEKELPARVLGAENGR